MLTRNRGKPKSVVANLGLLKKRSKRTLKSPESPKIQTESILISTASCDTPLDPSTCVKAPEETATNIADQVNKSSLSGSLNEQNEDVKDETFEHLTHPATEIPSKTSYSCVNIHGRLQNHLPPVGSASFRLCDDMLQEILDEISSSGVVFPSRRHFLRSKRPLCELNEKESAVYMFSDLKLQDLFNTVVVVNQGKINKDLDKKDAFLAAALIARPGIRESLRKRREKMKQMKRSTVGRLRPNPRPRRFMDMVSPSSEISVRFTRNVRDGQFAKKLAQAKSKASHILLTTKTEAKRGRPRKSSRQQHENSKPTFKHTSMTTRPRRSVDIRHHIDWKFCYGAPSEKKVQRIDFSNRRHRQIVSSNESNEEEKQGDDTRGGVKIDDEVSNSPQFEKPSLESDTSSVNKLDETTIDCLSKGGKFSPAIAAEPKKRSDSILFKRKRRTNSSLIGGRRDHQEESNFSPRTRTSSSDSSNAFAGAAEYYSRATAYKSPDRALISSHHKSDSRFSGRNSKTLHHSRRIGNFIEGRRSNNYKHESSRRLTLLDRVVLGLTCSVAQEGDEIHIKQLHADDFNILSQRLNETGFTIKSLALKPNANNDAEYNIVLSCTPTLDISHRQGRKFSPASVTTEPDFSTANAVTKTQAATASIYTETGTHSDNEARSKPEESSPPVRPSSTIAFGRPKVLVATRRRSGFGSDRAIPKYHHPLQRLSMRNIMATSKLSRRPHSRDNAEDGSDDDEPSSTIVGLGPLGFRRHSPRKVIRKVYTGTSTVPKILNRKRLLVAGGVYPPAAPVTSAAPSTSVGEDTVIENVIPQTALNHPSTRSTPEPSGVETAGGQTSEDQPSSSVSALVGFDSPTTQHIIDESPVTISCDVPNALTTSSAVVVANPSKSQGSDDASNYPANLMSASQILRLKRLHDDQPHPLSTSSASAESLQHAPAIPTQSQAKFTTTTTHSVDPSAGGSSGGGTKLYPSPVEVVVPSASGGDDDGIDFELNSSVIHLQHRPQQAGSEQYFPEHYRFIPGAHLLSSTRSTTIPSTPIPTLNAATTAYKATSVPTFLPQQRFTQPTTGVFQYFATGSFSQPSAKQTVKRSVIPSLTTSAMISTPPRTLDSPTNSLLTGRCIVSTSAALTTHVTSTTTSTRRPVVHKYHSFRKISPKNRLTPTTPLQNTATSKPSSSQLLKSLLESGSGTNVSQPSSSTAPTVTSQVAAIPNLPSGTVFHNQPAHQSRGTWQLGLRPIVLGASITPAATAVSSAPQPLTPSKAEVISPEDVPQPVLHNDADKRDDGGGGDVNRSLSDASETVGS